MRDAVKTFAYTEQAYFPNVGWASRPTHQSKNSRESGNSYSASHNVPKESQERRLITESEADGLKSIVYRTAARSEPPGSAQAAKDLALSKHYADKKDDLMRHPYRFLGRTLNK